MAAMPSRIYGLGQRSLWHDEAVLYGIGQGSIGEVIEKNAAQNSAPPAFALIVAAVSRFNTSEAGLRLPSAAAGILGIPLFYLLTRRFCSAFASLSASALLVWAPFHVEYSQQLREYSFAFLLAVLLSLSYLRCVSTGYGRDVAIFAVIAVVSLLTQYGLAVLVAVFMLLGVLRASRAGREARGQLMRWLVALATVGATSALVYFTTLDQQLRPRGFGYLERGYFDGGLLEVLPFVYRQTYEVILFAFPDPPLLILVTATGALSLVRGARKRQAAEVVFLPVMAAVLLGLARFYPLVGARQSIYLMPAIFLTAAFGLNYIHAVDRRHVVAIPLILLMLRAEAGPALSYLRSAGIEEMRPIAARLTEALKPGDRVFVCEGALPAFDYYTDEDTLAIIRGVPGEAWQGQLEELLGSPARIWIVVSHCGEPSTYADFAGRRRDVEQVMNASGAWLYLARHRQPAGFLGRHYHKARESAPGPGTVEATSFADFKYAQARTLTGGAVCDLHRCRIPLAV